MENWVETVKKLDEELVAIIQDFLLLAPLSWSKDVMHDFLAGVENGNLRLPKVEYAKSDYSARIETLTAYIKKIGNDDHPAVAFLRDTAGSYHDACRILQGVGTKDVSEFSEKLYGNPRDVLPGYKRRSIDIAKYFIRIADGYKNMVSEEPLIYTSKQFAKELKRQLKKKINYKYDPIDIIVDNSITARVAAGSNYVKIRADAMFSTNDFEQLFHHEVMIHTLTYINGRKQPILKTLGYNAPRTTATQEGLAVFAEYINLSIELVRIKRIALRIIAIDMAEKGADFIDLFKFYQKHGQNNEESYYSAMRIFRGGLPEGGIVFYKDNVYLRGLIEVASFLKQAMHHGMIHDIALLFCGKLTTHDVIRLKPLIDANHIADPVYMPDWASRSSQLAAHLAFNDLTERFKLKSEMV